MFNIILFILVALIIFYGGMLLGVHTCKQNYGIPKYIATHEELLEYMNGTH